MTPLILDEIAPAIGAKPLGSLQPIRVTGISTDSRTIAAGNLFFAIPGERFDGHAFVGAALAVGCGAVVERSRWQGGPPPTGKGLLMVTDAVTALGGLASFYRGRLAGTVIAVTGSNGKTTTKAMIAHVLSGHKQGRAGKKSFNNHIGVPVTLLSADVTDEYVVVEIGSSTPGEIDRLARLATPSVAVITAVAEAHVERLRDVHGVAFEKASVLKHVRRGGLAVVNIEHEAMRLVLFGSEKSMDDHHPDRPSMLTYGSSEQADLRLTAWRQDGEMLRMEINGRIELSLPATGRHNALNAVAAFAVARRLGLTEDQIAERFESFAPPAMRVERQRVGGLEIINDAYNANPGSMEAALAVLRSTRATGRRVLVVGDMAELGDRSDYWHTWLGREAAGMPIGLLVAVGEHADAVVASARVTLRDNGRSRRGRPKLLALATTDEAVAEVPGLLKPDDLVLVKGSRAVGLEQVVEAMARWAQRAATDGADLPSRRIPAKARPSARSRRVKTSP